MDISMGFVQVRWKKRYKQGDNPHKLGSGRCMMYNIYIYNIYRDIYIYIYYIYTWYLQVELHPEVTKKNAEFMFGISNNFAIWHQDAALR
jgi:hypothetical protein